MTAPLRNLDAGVNARGAPAPHGAELLVESGPGKGSLFRAVFPAHRLRVAAPTPEPEPLPA